MKNNLKIILSPNTYLELTQKNDAREDAMPAADAWR
jgi:hypothetical protein